MKKKTLEQRVEELEARLQSNQLGCTLPHYPCTLQHFTPATTSYQQPGHYHGTGSPCYKNPCIWS